MDRKHFLKLVGAVCVGGWVPAGIVSCAPVHYVTVNREAGAFPVLKNEFIGIKKEIPYDRSFIVLESDELQFPIVVYKHTDEKYSALWSECTHQNCEVKPHDSLMQCPCHGSEFDKNGKVLEGPAETQLKTFSVTSDNENIYVHVQ